MFVLAEVDSNQGAGSHSCACSHIGTDALLQEQHAAVAAALVIGDGVAEFVVRRTEAARVKLMSVSDDTIQKACKYFICATLSFV